MPFLSFLFKRKVSLRPQYPRRVSDYSRLTLGEWVGTGTTVKQVSEIVIIIIVIVILNALQLLANVSLSWSPTKPLRDTRYSTYLCCLELFILLSTRPSLDRHSVKLTIAAMSVNPQYNGPINTANPIPDGESRISIYGCVHTFILCFSGPLTAEHGLRSRTISYLRTSMHLRVMQLQAQHSTRSRSNCYFRNHHRSTSILHLQEQTH